MRKLLGKLSDIINTLIRVVGRDKGASASLSLPDKFKDVLERSIQIGMYAHLDKSAGEISVQIVQAEDRRRERRQREWDAWRANNRALFGM